MSSVPERSEIDEEYKWDLESIYASDDEWEAAYEAVEDRIDELEAYEGRVTEDGETLLAVLQLRDDLDRRMETVYNYARMRRDEDTTDPHYQALAARAGSLSSRLASAASFVVPELQRADPDEVDAMIERTEGLETYEHYLHDVMRMKPHTRSAEVEALLADLGEVIGGGGDVYSMLTNADMTFPAVEDPDGETVEITLSNFTNLLKRPDREFRREVYEAFYDEWATVRNAVGEAFKNSVKTDVKLARARNYETAREAALHGPNIPVSVYDTLVETIRDNLAALHRHAELKRECLGVDDLRMWDLYMPLTGTESPDLPYGRARDHVVEAVGLLGDDYRSRVEAGLDSRWVDVYETANKQSGAYSGGAYDTQPFVLMNYQDDVSSMYTLAHELGHSLHSQYTSETQPYVYGDYDIFVAEVASTVNEALLTHHLLETVEDTTFRRHVLNEYLERFRGTLFRQTMFADFEQRVHRLEEEGEALTPDRVDEVYRDVKEDFYEPAVVDDRIAREWMRIPHFYRGFYVFQYSTGMSAAVALARDVVEEGAPAAERYIEFLRRGRSDYPLELLRGAGVDMSTAAPVEAAVDAYHEALEEMAELV